MSLSKKNLSKLNTFIKKNKRVNKNNTIKNLQNSNTSNQIEDFSKIFYSIIDNSENINETTKPNQLLKKSEVNFHNINSSETYSSMNLSQEDQLYDEFNYLLDE